MHWLFENIENLALISPQRVAVDDLGVMMTYSRLLDEVRTLSSLVSGHCTGILLQNGIEWLICDLALLHTSTCCVPLPVFFSDTQLRHIIEDAGIQQVITDSPERLGNIIQSTEHYSLRVNDTTLTLFSLDNKVKNIPANIIKVTYTSGTTGTPKGVCLDQVSLANVTGSLARAAQAGPHDTSLSLLPLSTLLENIAGIYVPLSVGATCKIPGDNLSGISGSSDVDMARLLQCINTARPTSMVLIPQLLHALVSAVEQGVQLPPTLRFVAVGGSRVSTHLLQRARECGVPVYEGYGLSEAGSVVSLNTPQQQRPGSVGKPLPHLAVSIDEGEVVVTGHLFNGYLHDGDFSPVSRWATGDTGYLDADGYLYLSGRKRDIYCTAYGRNIDPAWVENELQAEDVVMQAVVLGDARPFNIAIIVPRAGTVHESLVQAVNKANVRLPDYAQIREWLVANAPFDRASGMLTISGQVKRSVVATHYADAIEGIYKEVITA